jgi:hypothetical protein
MDSYRILHTKKTYKCYYCRNKFSSYINHIFHFIENERCLNHGAERLLSFDSDKCIVGYIYG